MGKLNDDENGALVNACEDGRDKRLRRANVFMVIVVIVVAFGIYCFVINARMNSCQASDLNLSIASFLCLSKMRTRRLVVVPMTPYDGYNVCIVASLL